MTDLGRRIRQHQPFLVWSMATIIVLIGLAVLIKANSPATYRILFRDPVASTGVSIYRGLFSQIGIMCWSMGIGATALGSILAYRQQTPNMYFLQASLAITALLAFDDAFLLHEEVFTDLLGVPEVVVFGAYALSIVAYLLYFSDRVLRTPQVLLLLALSFLALSVGVDLVPKLALVVGADGVFLLEDGAKLAGIVCWVAYYVRYCALTLSERAGDPGYGRE